MLREVAFGKTLAMSMTDYFFSVKHAGRSDLFAGLSVWEDEEYGLQEQMPKVKEWYDGFRFGNYGSIYNPWSVTNYLAEKNLWITGQIPAQIT